MKKVYLDEKLKKYIVPTELRNNSKSQGKIFTPGTRLPLGEAKFIRLFTAWSTISGEAGNIDIDLASGFIKDIDGKLEMTPIAYFNESESYAVHSGDYTSCREYKQGHTEITAEFIDIEIEKAIADGFQYIITADFIFSGAEDYNDVKTYSGVQLLSNLRTEKTGYININDYLFKMELHGEFQSHVALAVDLITKEIVIIDQYSKESKGINIDSMGYKLEEYKKLYFNASDYKENMYDFLIMYCEANEIQVIDNIDSADIIFSYDDYKDIKENQELFNISNNLEKILDLLN